MFHGASGHPWPARMAALQGIKAFADRMSPKDAAPTTNTAEESESIAAEASGPWLQSLIPGMVWEESVQ